MAKEDITLHLDSDKSKSHIQRQRGKPAITDNYLFLVEYFEITEEEREYREIERAINNEFRMLSSFQDKSRKEIYNESTVDLSRINPFSRNALGLV